MTGTVVRSRALRMVLAQLTGDGQALYMTYREFADCGNCVHEVAEELALIAAAFSVLATDGPGATTCVGGIDRVTDMLADALDSAGQL
ncbi:hypothetical protein MCHLDSM_03014 [Mycolicibacterium chlorophenolicum]|uniref:Uncharacterized protein n=2 Tax=Mycolicibacterium chlorophenolicum TaxID=37916 RepID=A0A0J6W0L0_9MYCO|nr:hypothetical protein MCHLDSM_03014 [Mycolicibacterium chlorophenolicum]